MTLTQRPVVPGFNPDPVHTTIVLYQFVYFNFDLILDIHAWHKINVVFQEFPLQHHLTRSLYVLKTC